MNTARSLVTKIMSNAANITIRRSADRGYADHGWLKTFHTFSFASYFNPDFMSFGSIRVLNEDRVAPSNGFPTHPHRDAEIFSYILSGELTHRDSMVTKGQEGAGSQGKKDDFYRMHRGDVQFTTGGTGIAHSEQNEDTKDPVHFLQIWALPWKKGLKPRYHTQTFSDEEKKKRFIPILSPLKAGVNASAQDEDSAEPTIKGTIPIHADMLMGAGHIGAGKVFDWKIGGTTGSTNEVGRRVYFHLPMTKNGQAKVRLNGSERLDLSEGDGAFVQDVSQGDVVKVENLTDVEAEVIVLDSN